MKTGWSKLWLALVPVVVHAALALVFALSTPYAQRGYIQESLQPDIGAPDEISHVEYVKEARNGVWPSLDLQLLKTDKQYRARDYENLQPPAYYFAEAAWSKITGATDLDSYSDGIKLRTLSVIFGCLGVLAVFFGALWSFDSMKLAVTSSLFAALLPMNAAISGSVTNDSLLIALFSWFLAIAIHGIRTGWSTKNVILAVVVTALAVWTKTTGLILLPCLVLAWLLPARAKLSWKLSLAGVVGCLILISPILARNESAYGEPLGLKTFNEAFQDTAKSSDIQGLIASQGGNPTLDYWTTWVGWWTARSFIGVFGYMDIWVNETGSPISSPSNPNAIYRVTLAIFALLAIGWLLSLKDPNPEYSASVAVLCGAIFFLILGAFIKFNMTYFQAQGRYLLPAIAPVSFGLAAGLRKLSGRNLTMAMVAFIGWMSFLGLKSLLVIRAEFPRRFASTEKGPLNNFAGNSLSSLLVEKDSGVGSYRSD